MADVTGCEGDAAIYWIRDTSDEDQPIVFVPGVSGRKVGSGCGGERKMRSGCGGERKSGVVAGCSSGRRKTTCGVKSSPQTQTRTSPSPAMNPSLTTEQVLCEAVKATSHVSLKDLCPEDKRRIANLIQELARVSEEKDETVQKCRDEQESFERKILQLEQQNQLIVQERESLQRQYRECQELLSLYQQYLTQQQEKLNQSIAQLNQSRSQHEVSSSEDAAAAAAAAARGREPALDGSYLGLPPGTAGQEKPPQPSSCSPGNGGARSGAPALGGDSVDVTVGGATELHGWGPHQSAEVSTGRGSGRDQAEGEGGINTPPVLRRTILQGLDEGGGMATMPPCGQKVWEERKHRLLLQKMELEMERERLQVRLAQQEERLIRQNQQLRQSRLHFSRFRDAGADLEHAVTGGADRRGRPPLAAQDTDHRDEAIGPGTVRAPPIGPEDHAEQCVDKMIKRNEVTHQTTHSYLHLKEPVPLSRGDPTISPVVSRPAAGSVWAPSLPRTPFIRSPDNLRKPCRMDSSLIDLLEVLSPVSRQDRTRRSVRKAAQSRPNLQGALLPTPRAPLWAPSCRTAEEDLEESQMLEDIFFIC